MKQSIHILLVEDNKGDVVLITEALQDSNNELKITTLSNGEKAVDYLEETDSLPDMIMLDINLPRVNGLEVLKFIKTSSTLCHIPVVMLTTSSAGKDVMESYKHHANCFITKPADVQDYIQALGAIENFWVNVATLPNMV
ncbi:MAG: response regulator [Bacteroidota bacterium]